MSQSDKNLNHVTQRLNAFMVQHNLRFVSWDGQMLVATTREGVLVSATELDHSSAIRPMWLHLEQWLKCVNAAAIDVNRP